MTGPAPAPLEAPPYTTEWFNKAIIGRLPGLVGMSIVESGPGSVTSRMEVRPDLLAPNGYLHAASVVALADTSCGFGTLCSLPEGASGFTTIEVKANYIGTTRDGNVTCNATLSHGGRTTQVWDAEVTDEGNGRTIALFRCTQLIVYPRDPSGA